MSDIPEEEIFFANIIASIRNRPRQEILKALAMLAAAYERDGVIYIFGNGGSRVMAKHWVIDLNKTVFSGNLKKHPRRFHAVLVPSLDEELTAWVNDTRDNSEFSGPLQNCLGDSDLVMAISSSGNSPNIVKAVEVAKSRGVPVIGISGFDGGKLNELADAKILIPAEAGDYYTVESVHGAILHHMIKKLKVHFEFLLERGD